MCPVCNVVCVSGGMLGHGCGRRIYQCSRCGGCYQCEHEAIYEQGKWVWLCRDKKRRSAMCESCGCDGGAQTPPPRIPLNGLNWPF